MIAPPARALKGWQCVVNEGQHRAEEILGLNILDVKYLRIYDAKGTTLPLVFM